MRRLFGATCLVLLLCAPACDNVGRAFDPSVDPGGPDPDAGASAIQIVPRGGEVREGRPRVRAVYPADAGWPAAVPILVEFSESVNESSIAPTSPNATDGRIVLRVQGTTQALPCQYDFLANGRLLLMRPLTALSTPPNAMYEVVLLADSRDCDGVRFQVGQGGTVLTTFQTNQDASITDGRILAVYPRNNVRDATRETPYLVVFDRPANAATVRPENLFLRPAGGSALTGTLTRPLSTVGVEDTRVIRFTPATPFAANATFELVVNSSITFGADGQLDFRGRTPFAEFTTVSPAAPTAIELGNAAPGFANKINRNNVDQVVMNVVTPADAAPGDRVVARIYGADARTTVAGDMGFVERTADVTQAGVQTVVVGFPGLLGPVSNPRFEDGEVTFAAQLLRGSQQSSFIQHASSVEPRYDITPPTLLRAGPASSADGIDLVSDVEFVAFYGTASEAIATASLVDGVNPATGLFAAESGGRFLIQPLPIGRLTAPRPYSLVFTDTAGNMSVAAATGNLVQRGLITGSLAGTLTVEAYDDATLLPIGGATVLVDPETPTKPATDQRVGMTDGSGRVTFTGLGNNPRTITILRPGYDLVTMYAMRSAYASLPLRPQTGNEATFRGMVGLLTTAGQVVQPPPGTTVVVGNNSVADRSVLGVRSASASPLTIPDTAIQPNRPQVITAFAGSFEPTASPTFSHQAVQMLGPTLLVPAPPAAPAAAGAVAQQTLVAVEAGGAINALLGPFTEDFALATGLDTGTLLNGAPLVRVTMSIPGFGGQVLAGIGFSTNTAGAAYSINANFGAPVAAFFAGLGPLFWVVAEARDAGGRISRHRSLLDATTGQVTNALDPQAIPVITTPAGTSQGSPAVTVADVLDESILPVGGAAIGEAVLDLIAIDPAGRRWHVMFVDRDAAGATDTFQLPDISAAGVAGLVAGSWSVVAEARLLITGTLATSDDLMLSERLRSEVLYSRSAAVTFTVQ